MRHDFYRDGKKEFPLSHFVVFVDDKMQHDYSYHLVEPAGENFAPDFKPELTPIEMLKENILTTVVTSFPNSGLKMLIFPRAVRI